jgi:hypothetical protein
MLLSEAFPCLSGTADKKAAFRELQDEMMEMVDSLGLDVPLSVISRQPWC